MLFNMTNLPQVTIGAVEGVARGAGNELLVSLEMRFATKTYVLFGQPEIGIGIGVGAGGIQYLARLIERGRAMEYVLLSSLFIQFVFHTHETDEQILKRYLELSNLEIESKN